MHLFYCPDKKELPQEEWQHLRAHRLRPGDQFYITDGKGYRALVALEKAGSPGSSFHVLEEYTDPPPAYYVHLLVAPTKNHDRMEWLLEKATEIGVSRFTPIICQHSERKQVRLERLERLCIQAMKQSLKSYKPHIDPPIPFEHAMRIPPKGQRFIAHLLHGQTPHLFSCLHKPVCCEIFIGPEGDFSEAEIKYALENHSLAISLGRYRLRTETAALAACLIVQIVQEQ